MKLIIPTLILALTVTACGQSAAADQSGGETHHPASILGQTTTPLADEAAIKQAIAGKQVLLKFGATWCGPCRMIAPELSALASERSDLTVIDVDTDHFPAIAEAYQVESIPALFLIRDGKVVAEQGGYMPKADIAAWIDSQ